MTECNSFKTDNIYPNLNNQEQFRLKKINKIKDCFFAKIKERESMSTRLSKYVASFNYFDNALIVLSVTTGSISNASFATVIGAPVGTVNTRFSLAFSIFTEIVNNCQKQQEIKKNQNKIVLLARSK